MLINYLILIIVNYYHLKNNIDHFWMFTPDMGNLPLWRGHNQIVDTDMCPVGVHICLEL